MKRFHLQPLCRVCFGLLTPMLMTMGGVSLAVAQGPVLVDPAANDEAPVIEEPPIEESPESAATEESPTPAPGPEPADSDAPAPGSDVSTLTEAEAKDSAQQAKQEMLRKLEAAKRASNRTAAASNEESLAEADDARDAAPTDRSLRREDSLPADSLPEDEAVPADPEELPAPSVRASRTTRDAVPQRRLRSSRDVARDRDVDARDPQLDRPADRNRMRSVVVPSRVPEIDRGQRAWESLGIVLDGRFEDSLVVRRVEPGTPAEQIGLRAGDTIVSINGRDVYSADDVLDVLAEMRSVRDLDLGIARRSNRTLRLSARTANSRVRVDPEVDQTAYESYFRGLPPADAESNSDYRVEPDYPAPDAYLLRRPSYAELYPEERYRAEPPPERRGLFRGRLLGRFRSR